MYQEDSFKVMKNNNIIAEPKNDKELLVLSSSGDIIELNETATYILNNCDGKVSVKLQRYYLKFVIIRKTLILMSCIQMYYKLLMICVDLVL